MPRLVFIIVIFFNLHVQVFSQSDKPNILFIYVDDLNDYVQEFDGHPQTTTPAMQMLSDNGTVFLNAHASAPKCMPSRTSTITGKDPFYTDVYRNKACHPLREYVDGELFILPEYLKDNANYFTYGTGKILHCFDSYPEYDDITADPCAKNLSWNKYVMFPGGENPDVIDYGNAHNQGLKSFQWGMIPDSMEHTMWDYQATDSLISFIQNVGSGADNACGKQLFMMIGYHKPHQLLFIPEKYFFDYYLTDFYSEPFTAPYNHPPGTYPYNGVVMPPQPAVLYQDYYNLPNDSLGQYFSDIATSYSGFANKVNELQPLPDIGIDDDAAVKEIMNEAYRANFVIAYLAAVRYIDTQLNRLLTTLQQYPEIYNNTVIILISDHGYALGEKRHWQKGTMWETDMRVPMIIADMRNPKKQETTSMVSLLDLFPTICDYAGVNYPLFSDSSRYLDGHSLMPLIEHPEKQIEEIALGSYTQQPDKEQAFCFPAYSVRSDRFHYIQYTSNGAGWEPECDGDHAWKEEECYEIGTNKEVDPNEWNNLIKDPDYQPLIRYLRQWLPNGNMYSKKTIKALIKTGPIECFAEQGDIIALSAVLLDTLGEPVADTGNYVLRWTNNFNADTSYGIHIDFPVSTIDAFTFATKERVIYYFELVDTLNNTIAAFDLKYLYINADNAPDVSFTVNDNNKLQAEIQNVQLTGSYNSVEWDFGDGHIFKTENPGPYSYATPGKYLITCSLYYGNEQSCKISYTQEYETPLPLEKDLNDWFMFPNPSDNYVYFFDPALSQSALFTLYTLTGEMVKQANISSVSGYYNFSVQNLHAGAYVASFYTDNGVYSTLMMVHH